MPGFGPVDGGSSPPGPIRKMNIFLSAGVILLVSYLLVWLGRKVKVPSVVMLIIAGLLFNVPFLSGIFISENLMALEILGTIGLFVLMFLAGLEISWCQLYKERKDATFIAFFASIFPFTLGTIVFIAIGFSFFTSAMVGISMSITAEATKARVLIDLGKLRTRLGAAMMGAGIIDDIIGIGLFMAIALVFGSFSKESLVTFGVIGSFFLGILFNRKIRENVMEKNLVEKILLFGIVPFFFISMGIRFDFNSLVLNPLILVLVIFLGIFGKIGGVFLTKNYTKFTNKQLILVGWAMNSRGAIELALALIALNIGLINAELYSSIIVMGLVTTLIFPFIITHMIKKYKKIMN